MMRLEYFYRPHRSNPRIRESEPSLNQLGGTFWVYLHNGTRRPYPVSSILLNKRDVETIRPGKGLNWYRLTHELIPPRTTATLILNLQREMLNNAPIELVVRLGSDMEVSAQLEPRVCPAVLASAWLEGRRLWLVVRNDDTARPLQVVRVRVDGRSLRFRALAPDAEPNGGVNFLVATLPRMPEPHRSLPVQVDAQLGGQPWLLGGAVRPMSRVFPLGAWRTSIWTNDAERAAWRERGFDTFVFNGTQELTEVEQRAFTEICPREGVKALPHCGFPRPATAFIERNRQNTHIIAYMIKDEPDWSDPARFDNWHVPALCERVAKVFRDREGIPPVYLNLARSRRFGEFAEIPDIACYDAYRVGAPMADEAPPNEWAGLLELAAAYTEDLRFNCEPLPFWVWAQGAHPWNERVWINGALGRACPTPEEIRVQLWFQLSRGAKGVLWFIGFDETEFRRHYMEAKNIPALRALPEGERAALVEQLVQHGREAFEEQTRLNRFLQPLCDDLLRMDWRPNGVRVLSATNPRKLDATMLVGERAAAVWLTNFDYEIHPQGYRFREQRGIEIEALLPRWLRPKTATLKTPDGSARPLALQSAGASTVCVRIDALPLQVGLVWLE
ncbi:MAG: hypothetical protein NZ874_02275 [Fimbriimonadales bacterium]|nr:hypothetical protein [Fimbriimonadales bacterium]